MCSWYSPVIRQWTAIPALNQKNYVALDSSICTIAERTLFLSATWNKFKYLDDDPQHAVDWSKSSAGHQTGPSYVAVLLMGLGQRDSFLLASKKPNGIKCKIIWCIKQQNGLITNCWRIDTADGSIAATTTTTVAIIVVTFYRIKASAVTALKWVYCSVIAIHVRQMGRCATNRTAHYNDT